MDLSDNQATVTKPTPLLEKGLLALIVVMALAYCPWCYESAECSRVAIVKVAAMALLVGWLAAGARHIKMTPLNRPFVLFLLLFAAATALSVSQLRSFRELTLSMSLAILFLAFREAASRPQFAVCAAEAMVVAGVPVAIYGVLQHFGIDFVERWKPFVAYRCISTFGHPIYLAAFMAMALTANAALLVRAAGRRRLLLAVSFVLLLYCLGNTLGRAGAGAAVAGCLVVAVVCRRQLVQQRRAFLMLAAAVAVLAVIDWLATGPTQLMLARLADAPGGQSTEDRVQLWHAAIPVISHRPLIGWGPGCFGLVLPRFTNSENLAWQLPNKAPGKCPHNELLHIASTAGIPTAIVWVWLVLAGLAAGVRLLRKVPESERPVVAGWMGVVVAYFLQSLVTPRITATVFPFWAAMGVLDGYAVPARSTGWLPGARGRILAAAAAAAIAVVMVPSVVGPVLASRQYRLAIEDRDARRFDSALGHLLAATALDPMNPDSWFGIAETCRQAAAAGDRRLLVFGQMACSHMLSSDPYNGFAREVAGAIYGLSSAPNDPKGRDRALREYRAAIALYPGMSSFHNDLGIYYQTLGWQREAEAEYRLAIRLESPFGEPEANLARILWRRGRTDQALALLDAAMRKSPERNPHLVTYRSLRHQMLQGMNAKRGGQPG